MLDRPALSLVLGALALAAASAPGSAQFPQTLPNWKTEPPLDPGAYGRTALADIDGDLMLDCALVRDGMLEVVCAPSLFGALLTDIEPANDVARLPGVAGPDTLVVVGPAGVVELAWDPVAVDWIVDVLSDDEDWLDARRIVVADVVNGRPSFAGIAEDGHSLRLLEWDGSAYEDRSIHDTAAEMLDLVVFDRFGDGRRELAATSAEALGIFEVTSEPEVVPATWELDDLYDLTYFTSVGLAVGSDGCSAQEWLAWTGDGPGGTTQWLLTIRGSVASTPVNLQGPRGVVGLASGDWNGDCDTDLLLSWQETEQVPVLENFGAAAGAPFSILAQDEGVLYLDAGDPQAAATENATWPVCGDLDGDGDVDVCFPVQSEDKLYSGLNPTVDEEALMPLIGLPSEPTPTLQGTPALSTFAASLPPSNVRLVTRIDEDDDPIGETLVFTIHVDPATAPATATDVEVLVWRLGNHMSGTTNPVSLEPEGFSLSEGFSQEVQIPLEDGDIATQEFAAVYFWTQRLVTKVDGVVTEVFPGRVYGFQAAGYSSAQWYWLSDPDRMGWAPFDVADGGIFEPPPVEPILLGRGLALPMLPNLPENNPPSRP